MTHEEAAAFVIPIGKYANRRLTLEEIADDEDDRDYLKWLKGVRDDDEGHVPDDLDEALEVYLEGE